MAPATLENTPAKAYIIQNGCRFGLIPGVMIGGRFRANGDGPTKLVVEGLNESSNLTTPPQDVSNPDLEKLFDTLADWNHQLKHAKIDFKGPQP